MTENLRDKLKQIAKDNGLSVKDVIALTANNDPFYMGSPAQVAQGEWFAYHWNERKRKLQAQGINNFKANMRGLHYNFQATNDVQLPSTVRWTEEINGVKVKKSTDIYINNHACWKFLCQAAKCARYLGLVPASEFFDAKAGELIQYQPYKTDEQLQQEAIEAEVNYGWHTSNDPYSWPRDDMDRFELPELPELPDLPYSLPERPELRAKGGHYDQKYVIEIWCEKSSVVMPVERYCQDNNINMVVGAGELSITACLEFIERAKRYAKPVLVLYIADYDPAGYQMSLSVSRKIEYFITTHAEKESIDIKVVPIILTVDQIKEYALPTVPAKQTDNRFDKWNDTHGEQTVVELDSLEALHPRILETLLSNYVENYIDPDYRHTVYQVLSDYQASLDDVSDYTQDTYRDEIDELEYEYRDLYNEWEQTREEFTEMIKPFQAKIDAYKERLQSIAERTKDAHDAMRLELEEDKQKLIAPEQPPHNLPNENHDAKLFDSERDYFTQMRYYNARKDNVDLSNIE